MAEFYKRFENGVGNLLGEGGDGEVYGAVDKPWAAIKIITLNEDDDTEYQKMRAKQEQQLLAEASIGNIYGIYFDEYTDSNGKRMRFIHKVYDRFDWCLDDLIEAMDVRMTEQQMKHVIFDVCQDVQSLHRQGFIHLDIKPNNILYCKKGTWMKKYEDKGTFKLIDYDGATWNRSIDENGDEILDEGIEIPWQGMSCL